jgi:hypothetical protein
LKLGVSLSRGRLATKGTKSTKGLKEILIAFVLFVRFVADPIPQGSGTTVAQGALEAF